ncbi:MAG: RiPP maturation radical SAM C-methyltransferase [Thermodesulfobacteriota bacterium]|nr:RiPP maturation radical SAM C-methyltransferase [Thermodesulfobacteriota bacterium]
MNSTRPLKRVVLLSTPWSFFSRPSIQLGTLKSYLRVQFPKLKVITHHFYLQVAERIGYKLYHAISERTWLAETVYAALLYPERFESIEKLFIKEAKGKPLLHDVDFKTLTKRVAKVTDDFIDQEDWDRFGLAGFSVCLCQLTSAIYFIRRIKKRSSSLPVVVGGSMFSGVSAKNFVKLFPEIDFMVIGEGELPLSRLVGNLKNWQKTGDFPPIPGTISAKEPDMIESLGFSQIEDLANLPVPDYDDYFNLLKSFKPDKTFFPTLSAEISRGCWWKGKSVHRGRNSGCAFCNLNLQWKGYRSKNPDQVVAEIDYLTAKYQNLSVAFMDNLVPVNSSSEIFNKLGKLKKDFHLFCEIRATTPRRVLESMQRAGVREVQVGIEALSTRLLKKINKGTSAIQNLEIMKHCEELGIANHSNLILHFPGSDREDVKETLKNLEFAIYFRPMRFVHFWLGLKSPVWQNPKDFAIKAVFNHPNYTTLFPPDICRQMVFMVQAYRGDLGYQRRLWQPVKQRIRKWKKEYTEIQKGPVKSPILSYRDGKDFLIIRQKRVSADPFTHRLEGLSRDIYLFCGHHRSFKRILQQFSQLSEDRLIPFLKMMTDKKLMFEENGKYLSLAISAYKKS